MPTYRYRCGAGHDFEEWASIDVDSSTAPCAVHATDAVKVMVSPRLSPRVNGHGRLPSSGAPAGNRNSWERGIALDERGVPYIDNGKTIPIKKFAAGRQRYEARIRELRQHPDPFAVQQAAS